MQLGSGAVARGVGTLLAVTTLAPVVAGAEVDGRWVGAIDLASAELGIVVELEQRDDAWTGTIDIPLQNVTDLGLEDVEVDGDTVRFELASPLGRAVFDGVLNEEGSGIAGDFSQAGATYPFHLERSDARTPTPTGTSSGPEAAADPEPTVAAAVDSLVRLAEGALEPWRVPGMAVGVVLDGEVLLARGFGERDRESGAPVTERTVFAIGSATKAFTALTLATLVDEGLLDWDTPIRDYLPDFELHASVATERATTRDLLCHRTGLPRHDLLWYGSRLGREELYRRLPYLELNEGFRVQWQYQNLMYMTAGYLGGILAGDTWEGLVTERVLEPLSMRGANFAVSESQRLEDHARPYDVRDGELEEIPFRDLSSIGPAGSINANLEDMITWVRLHIGGGEVDGVRIVSRPVMDELHTPQMVISRPVTELTTPMTAYAMGWFVEPYRGRRTLHHGGNIDGFTSLVTFMPDDGLGVVVLTNRDGTGLPTAITRHAIDLLLGFEPRNWNQEGIVRLAAIEAQTEAAEARPDPSRWKDTEPSHDLDAYAGRYEHPGYGVIEIEKAGRRTLRLTYNQMSAELEHWHFDVFRASSGEHEALDELLVRFALDTQGNVESLAAPLEPMVAEIVFTARPPSVLDDPELVDELVGEYSLGPQTITIARKGDDTLTAYLPGQPLYTLDHYRDLDFRIRGLTGFTLRFEEEDGEVETLTLIQPNGVFVAEKRQGAR